MALVGLLFALTLYEIDKGAVATKLNGTLWYCEYVLGSLKYNLGISAISGTETLCSFYVDGSLDLKLVGTIVLYSLWRDIFKRSVELYILKGSNGDLHRNANSELSYLCLVDIAAEDKVLHIGKGSDCCTVVEGIGEDDGITNLYRDVENDTRDSAADEGATCTCVAL